MTKSPSSRQRIAVAPRPGPSQRVEIRVQDDGTVWAQVTKPKGTVPGLSYVIDEYTRVFDEVGYTDDVVASAEHNFHTAYWWAQQLLDFRTARPG